MEIGVIRIGNHHPITVTVNERGRGSDGPRRQVNKAALILWTTGVNIHDP